LKTLLLLLLSSTAFAGGPRYGYSDAKLDDEINNIYKDIRGVLSSGIRGTTAGDAAAAGMVGEYVESVVPSGSVGTASQYFDITSIPLTAGDWDVTGIGMYLRNGASWTGIEIGISQTSGNSGTGLVPGSSNIYYYPAAAGTTQNYVSLSIPSYRISLSGNSTVYLKGYLEYTAATPTRYGRLSARRVR